jgi:putative Ca2+/H+ antiporter (TMEM165/GDT1 family)
VTGPWLEVVTVAFVSQLVVLPGEKVQFIIAGLSTRFDPTVVVAAAGSAFAGWTVLEILAGQVLQRTLPAWALDVVTAGLFLLFALLLVRSAPDGHVGDTGTDGPAGHTDSEPPGRELREADPTGAVAGGRAATDGGSPPAVELPFGRELELDEDGTLGGFVPIFVLMAAGEFGDKTQLVTIGLATQYGAHPGIWVGEMAAIIPISLANAYLFHRVSGRVDARTAYLAGAALFGFFGLDTVLALVAGVSVWERVVATVSEALVSMLAVTPSLVALA